ncbi:MAG: helix-turn-helix domain-containing protein [Burkholderiales bacterium]|nr:helix-turn-helix domain-containing protein [Burkholderiales bacterium]
MKSVASLRRGLDVLALVQGRPASTLHDLHGATGIAKASLLRVLKTLQEAGLVMRRGADGAFLARPVDYRLDAHWRHVVELTHAAAPVLRALKRDVPWPSDVAVRDGDAMRTLDSNETRQDLQVNRRIMQYRPEMLRSAMGRAHLAFCPRAEREDLIRALATPAQRPAVEREVAATIARGYSIRDVRSIGPAGDESHPQAAIAVPVFARRKLIACLNCVWLRDAMSVDEVVARHLARLKSAADEIGGAFGASPRRRGDRQRSVVDLAR